MSRADLGLRLLETTFLPIWVISLCQPASHKQVLGATSTHIGRILCNDKSEGIAHITTRM